MVNPTSDLIMKECDSIIMKEQWWSFSQGPYTFEVDVKGLELVQA